MRPGPLQYEFLSAPSESEDALVGRIIQDCAFDERIQRQIVDRATKYVEVIRRHRGFNIERFMQQFSLSSSEGLAIMCLAEGMLRVGDESTASMFAMDLLSGKKWSLYVKKSKSIRALFVSLGLSLAGRFADINVEGGSLGGLLSRASGPFFLPILKRSIEFLGNEFVFAAGISAAIRRARVMQRFKFSFDLLGESARTQREADRYYNQYMSALDTIASSWPRDMVMPNMSVKLTALDPRVEWAKRKDLHERFLPKLIRLVRKAADCGVTITFDAEEAKRLDIYLDIMNKILLSDELRGVKNIGVVIQAYQVRAGEALDRIIGIAKVREAPIYVRLVKGAYWDYEIKHAQENGLDFYPVFTCKEYTDVNYIACAKKMLENSALIVPQFATHNALTVATIMELAGDKKIEFQKLYGMGDVLHNVVVQNYDVRIYAPIGAMRDLLAYLMRRILENGSSACFVNKVSDERVSIEQLVYDLHDHVMRSKCVGRVSLPRDIYLDRRSAMGFNLGYASDFDKIKENVAKFFNKRHVVGSVINGLPIINKDRLEKYSCPANLTDDLFEVCYASTEDMQKALSLAHASMSDWSSIGAERRADILSKIGDLFEDNKYELYALLIEEAGKTVSDAIGEVMEAIDFCRYYARQARQSIRPQIMPGPTGEENTLTWHPRGVFLCISPWNFPLAIFAGQIVAALVCGNAVIAKPADCTPAIATVAVKLMHEAGVPKEVLQLIFANGQAVSDHFVSDSRISGVAFTGSTATACAINTKLAQRTTGIVPLIAETGGQNAMVVDSTALLEQVTDDVLLSAFGSAGQRCSALRVLFIQDEIYDALLEMIVGAMNMLSIGDTRDFAVDIGPVINEMAKSKLEDHVSSMVGAGFRLVAKLEVKNKAGHFFAPHIIEVNSIDDIPDEKFGPILHVIKYKTQDLDSLLAQVNSYGFGLTFGIHSRIRDRIEHISSKVRMGNVYVNRSMIGARVESQPFGGEGKSGTGFKAGGPHYLLRFMVERTLTINLTAIGGNVELLR